MWKYSFSVSLVAYECDKKMRGDSQNGIWQSIAKWTKLFNGGKLKKFILFAKKARGQNYWRRKVRWQSKTLI